MNLSTSSKRFSVWCPGAKIVLCLLVWFCCHWSAHKNQKGLSYLSNSSGRSGGRGVRGQSASTSSASWVSLSLSITVSSWVIFTSLELLIENRFLISGSRSSGKLRASSQSLRDTHVSFWLMVLLAVCSLCATVWPKSFIQSSVMLKKIRVLILKEGNQGREGID